MILLMKTKKKIEVKNERLLFAVLLIALFIIFILYYNFVFSEVLARNAFANQMIEIADQNENPIFSVQRILLYSSANAIDNSDDLSLKDMSILQYTDISIYIDNLGTISDLTNENTVRELYIDNINIKTNSDMGNQLLNYKNPLNFGKYENLQLAENGRIDFNIVNTNSENESHDYSTPTFYTDCSNPISLGYINKDILTNYAATQDSNTVTFNGKVLQEANINLDDISYNLSFRINIVNNLGEKFVYNMAFDVDLNDANGGVYNGYIYKGKNTSGREYQFFKEL